MWRIFCSNWRTKRKGGRNWYKPKGLLTQKCSCETQREETCIVMAAPFSIPLHGRRRLVLDYSLVGLPKAFLPVFGWYLEQILISEFELGVTTFFSDLICLNFISQESKVRESLTLWSQGEKFPPVPEQPFINCFSAAIKCCFFLVQESVWFALVTSLSRILTSQSSVGLVQSPVKPQEFLLGMPNTKKKWVSFLFKCSVSDHQRTGNVGEPKTNTKVVGFFFIYIST